MARLGAKVSRCEVSSILKNTFWFGIFRRHRPRTSFLGLIGYMVHSGPKAWIFVLNRTSPILWAKRTRWCNWGKSAPERSFVHPKKHVFGRNFLTKPAPYLFSRPNWLYGAFGGKIVPDENFAQFCLKSPLEFVFPKNKFSFWIFVLNRTSPIFLAKQTRWHDWWQKCPGVKSHPS